MFSMYSSIYSFIDDSYFSTTKDRYLLMVSYITVNEMNSQRWKENEKLVNTILQRTYVDSAVFQVASAEVELILTD